MFLHNKTMWVLFIVNAAVMVAFTSGSECDKSGILLYEDLGCTPEYDSDTNCPKKYSCADFEPFNNNCVFRGKKFGDKEIVDSNLTYSSCVDGCICITDQSSAGSSPRFNCAIFDCPEWFGPPLNPECYRNYTLDHCCSVGEICSPFDNIEKCVVDGKEYREGQKFSPPNSCLSCVCQKGFQGKFEEPFCKRKLCGVQLRSAPDIQQACAPFYSKQFHNDVLCCPDSWICSDGSETILGDGKSDDACKFGDKSVKVGQYFEKFNISDNYGRNITKVVCGCTIPPLLHCRDA